MRGLLPIVLVLVAWTVFGSADAFAYPEPSTWFTALRELHADGLVVSALAGTFRTYLLGLAIGLVVGVLLGMAIGAFPLVNRAVSPFIDFFRALPPPAVVAVILLVIGPTFTSVLLMVSLGALWPIVLNTAAGMRAIPTLRREMAGSLGLSRTKTFRTVLLPSLLPSVFLGLKISVSIAFVVVLFVEILGVSEGVGSLLQERQERFDSAGTWALFLIIGVCGYLLNVAIALLERHFLKNWQMTP